MVAEKELTWNLLRLYSLRISLSPLLPKPTQPLYLPLASDEADDESPHPPTPGVAAAPVVLENSPSDERSPLLAGSATIVKAHPSASPASVKQGGFWSYFNPLIVSTVVALLLALVPGVQSRVFGRDGGPSVEGGERVRGLIGGTLGTTVGWLGGGFAVLELLGGGGGLRFRDV